MPRLDLQLEHTARAGQENPEGNISCCERLSHPNWNISGDIADFTEVGFFSSFFFKKKKKKNNEGKERKVFLTLFHPFYQKLGL